MGERENIARIRIAPNELPAVAGAGALLLTGLLVLPVMRLDPLSSHMALHIGMMNVLAPVAAVLAARRTASPFRSATALWCASILQTVLLLAWHAPALQREILHSSVLPIAMHASLLLAAIAFWYFIVSGGDRRWHAVAALLITGKLACLVAALLVFAPSVLYASHHGAAVTLDDQQVAGLLMITACPLSYVLAAIVIAAQILRDQPAAREQANPGIR